MPNKARKRPTKARAVAARRAKPRASTTKVGGAPEACPKDATAARDRFVRDLLIRGEAATLDRKGKLPLGATHVIKKQGADGSAVVKRLRFKMY